MYVTLRDEREEHNKVVIINGVATRIVKVENHRYLNIELVPGEDGVPERIDYYSSGKHFLPQKLRVSWSRYPSEKEWRFSITLKGQGFAKDGKTPLKGRTRRDDGTLDKNWPLSAGDVDPPDWIQEPWLQNLWAPHIPAVTGWPQEITEEKS